MKIMRATEDYLEAMLTRGEIKHPRSAALVKEILRKASLPEKAGK